MSPESRTDFFEQQDVARRHTQILARGMAAAIGTIIVAVYLLTMVVMLLIHGAGSGRVPGLNRHFQWIQPGTFGIVALGTLAVVGTASLAKFVQLHGGGAKVAELLGGRPIVDDSGDDGERRLLSVVEEVSLASGAPPPKLYVLDNERSINAFSAGHSSADAVIGVTRGALDHLSREELQAVIGHEFSHVINGDMRIHFRMVGILHGIMFIAEVGQMLWKPVEMVSDDKLSGEKIVRLWLVFSLMILVAAVPLGAALLGQSLFETFLWVLAALSVPVLPLLIGFLGLSFGRLIKSAICRQRERLADASAVQFTRSPEGIVGALKKIGGSKERRIRLAGVEIEEFSHLFFSNVLDESIFNPFPTHPSLARRIRQFEPGFDGSFTETLDVANEAGVPKADAAGADLDCYWFEAIKSMPAELVGAIQSATGAQAVTYSLLLKPGETQRECQLGALAESAGSEMKTATLEVEPIVRRQGARAGVAMFESARAALARLPQHDYHTFNRAVAQVIEAGEEITPLELAVQRVVADDLDRQVLGKSPADTQFVTVNSVLPDMMRLVSCLAHAGQKEKRAKVMAFEKGFAEFIQQHKHAHLLPAEDCTLDKVPASLIRLAQCSAGIKETFLDAAVKCATADDRVTVAEMELLYLFANTVGIPVPRLRVSEPA